MFFSRDQKQVWKNNKVRKGKKSGKKRRGKKRISNRKISTRKTSNKKQLIITVFLLALFISVLHNSLLWMPAKVAGTSQEQEKGEASGNRVLPAEDGPCGRPEITEDFLDMNPYSRSGITLKKVKGVVIHFTKASSHYIVGLDGEIIQCIPQNEISYASNNRNKDTISIECCHPGKDGKFNEKTYDSVVRLTAWICKMYGLSSQNVIRHYDVTGKMCPKYYVKHEQAWREFCNKVQECLEKRLIIIEK